MAHITNTSALKIEAGLRGSHFFDADALRFFSSRVHAAVYGGRFFVTSEQDRGGYYSAPQPRGYSVRSFELYTGDTGRPCIKIDTVGDFQGYETRAQAHAAAQRFAAELWTFTDEEVREITSQALDSLMWSETVMHGDSDELVPADSLGLDFSAAAIDIMAAEVRSFIALCADAHVPVRSAGDLTAIGHDLVLTMNGHGAGFWNRGLGILGINLTHWAKSLGTLSVWVRESEDGDMLEIER